MPIVDTKNLPLPILAAIANEDHISQGSHLGASTVAAPVRQVALRKQFRGELTEEASDRIWALFGQAVHVVLERAGRDQGAERRKLDEALALVRSLPGNADTADAERALERAQYQFDPTPQPFRTFVEERWEMEVLGWRIAARCDHLTLEGDGVLTDYKVTSVWSVKDGTAKDDWIAQLNVTRLCAKVARGLEPKALAVTAFLRDWRKNERLRYGSEYPEFQVATVPVPLWSDDETMAYLEARVAAHQAAQLEGKLPECTAEERWEKPTVYAVMKRGRKTAVKLYEHDRVRAETHAREAGTDHYVRVRPAESTRCAQYCDVLPKCAQGQRILAALAAASQEG